MRPALGMERSRLTMVETATTWSGSVAWRIPRRKPMTRMASPLVSDECMAIQQFRGKAYLTRQLVRTREERAQQRCPLQETEQEGGTEARLSMKDGEFATGEK